MRLWGGPVGSEPKTHPLALPGLPASCQRGEGRGSQGPSVRQGRGAQAQRGPPVLALAAPDGGDRGEDEEQEEGGQRGPSPASHAFLWATAGGAGQRLGRRIGVPLPLPPLPETLQGCARTRSGARAARRDTRPAVTQSLSILVSLSPPPSSRFWGASP